MAQYSAVMSRLMMRLDELYPKSLRIQFLLASTKISCKYLDGITIGLTIQLPKLPLSKATSISIRNCSRAMLQTTFRELMESDHQGRETFSAELGREKSFAHESGASI